jgi:hypothetical protein
VLYLPRKLFQHMFGEDATAGEVHPSLHQVKDRVFSFAANDGHVGQVDDQLALA